jgi:hypothetical protein
MCNQRNTPTLPTPARFADDPLYQPCFGSLHIIAKDRSGKLSKLEPSARAGNAIDMRKARVIGLAERVLLGITMSIIAFMLERQLNKALKRRKVRQAEDTRSNTGAS